MKTYCWSCDDFVEIAFPEWSLHNSHLIIGKCLKCGYQVYKRACRDQMTYEEIKENSNNEILKPLKKVKGGLLKNGKKKKR